MFTKWIGFVLIIVALAFAMQFTVENVLAQVSKDTTAVVSVEKGIPLPPNPPPVEFPKPLSLLFYVIVPAILPTIKKWLPKSTTRWWVAVIGSGLSGIACVLVSGVTWNWANVLIILFAAYGFSQLVWGIWKYLINDGVNPNPGK
jgi:hypothetical protein